MQRAIKFTYVLTAWIVGLFLFSMVMTYFNEYLQQTGFFGDRPHIPCKDCLFQSVDAVDKAHDWGARHYWYFALCITLWILSLARIAVWAWWYWDEKNPINKKL